MTPHSPERDNDLDLCLKQIDELFDVQGMLDTKLYKQHLVGYYANKQVLTTPKEL